MNRDVNKLKELYAKKSKHSNYQMLSTKLSEIISSNEIETNTRFEKERLIYILKNIDVMNKSIIDIGGNSGYFTFELLDKGAKKIHYYEGNKEHSEFVKLSAEVLNVVKHITITNGYFSFKDDVLKFSYDIVLLLNVLHHIGDDYGDEKISIEKAKDSIIQQLNSLAGITKKIVFQLGFNWKGNKELCLFENGTKTELISFIQKGIVDNWKIYKIGIAEEENGSINYYDLNEENINRFEHLGEFLNRPIFILESLKF